LQKARDELETRVRERTVDLSQALEKLRIENNQRQELEKTLRESENQVRFFASQCLTTQESERKRIAGELHDGIASSLIALKIRIERGAEKIDPGLNLELFHDLSSMVNEISGEIRRIMTDLRPAILDDLGIIPAMNWFLREYQKIYSRITVEAQVEVSEPEVPDSLKTPIFRITQEALNNIAKYSQASTVNLSFLKENNNIILAIQDNGRGFNLETVPKGLGLTTMRERAVLSGGTFAIEAAEGQGTTIRAIWNVDSI
jgi:signal transduction histidine kinase